MTERDGASTAAMSRPSTTDPDSDLADPLQDQFDEPDLADFGDLVELDDPDAPDGPGEQADVAVEPKEELPGRAKTDPVLHRRTSSLPSPSNGQGARPDAG